MVEPLYIGSVFAAGLLSFFSPCILPLLPVYLAYLGTSGETGSGDGAGGRKPGKLHLSPVLIGRTLLFILGLSTVFVLLGFGAGALGNLFNSSLFIAVCGIIVMLFGIYQTGLVKLSFLEREKRLDAGPTPGKGLFGAFLLGFTFSFGWTPCIGPVLAAVISLSASGGAAATGGLYMMVYSLGLSIPFMVMALFSDLLLMRVRKVYKYMNRLKVASGVLLILMGLLLFTGKLNTITAYLQL